MASAADRGGLPELAANLFQQATLHAAGTYDHARLALDQSGMRLRSGDYEGVICSLTDRGIESIASTHSLTLAAAATSRRALSNAASTNWALAVQDIQKAEELLNEANEGPRLIQRMQFLEASIYILVGTEGRNSKAVADQYQNLLLLSVASNSHAIRDRVRTRLEQ
ncbi:MAG: hypothetical protein DI630_05920 [Gordonia sp. (in: high G+C Gram-positive bacteria)]|nr:MAG: hypothetical protein DI630_05920 [Gordonia sp. (in: high G+C Gram-positive bacteria)]